MKRNRFQILFYLRINRKTKSGEYPIYMRVSISGANSAISTGRKIKTRYWNPKQGKIRDSFEKADSINDHLKYLRSQVYEYHSMIERQGQKPTAKMIVDAIAGREDSVHTLLSAYEYHNKMMADKTSKGISPGTYKNHRLTYSHLKQFIPNYCKSKDITLKDVSGRFITEFDHYLRTVKNNSNNGSMKNLVRLKKIILLSITNEWMSNNPFRNYKISFKKTDRVYLNAEELSTIENKELPTHKLQKVRDIFIFSCYTGLAYVDIKSLKAENIITGVDGNIWLIGHRGKSGIRYTLPLLPKALNILKKYKPDNKTDSSTRLFPVMSNQKMNDYLKDIATICGINKKISYHSSRHTFATTVTLVNGVPIETVSKMLGHTDISTTQIYARVIDEKIATDMLALKNKLE